jgi:tetratricopeptide (TPR) repeat protein
MHSIFGFPRRAFFLLHIAWILSAMLLPMTPAVGQSPACPVVAASDPTPAETAYAAAQYPQAKALYEEALTAQPHNLQLSAAVVRTLLHQGDLTQAAAHAEKNLAENPNSAIALTSLASVQLHQGVPWLALETLKTAAVADPCYARIHLVRSQLLRIDSMYASERAEIQSAYAIDPNDPDIRRAWQNIVSTAHEIESVEQSLSTSKDLDPESRQKAQATVRSMLSQLSESNQTCQVLPTVASAAFTLLPSHQDPKHIDGYRLEVRFPKSTAKLQIDTIASGLFISRALANENGFQQAAGDAPGTVHVDSVHIGPLEFRDCVVGVSDTPFAGNADGFIGTDMFAPWLITLDHPASKLLLDPLPRRQELLPGDRLKDPETQDFMPAYHRQQYLMVPVTLNNKTRKLFILDSGIRFSTMTPEAAHAVSTIKVNFTNAVQTVSGATLQVYRDNFDFQFANLTLTHQDHIIQLDPAAIERNTGIQVAGMLGFDMLHLLVLHLDYRDGLIKLDASSTSNEKPAAGAPANETAKASATGSITPVCEPADDRDRPIGSTIEAKVTALLDSAHLKPGKEIYVKLVNDWTSPFCNLSQGSILSGHVTAALSTRKPDSSELSMVFDHGECGGKSKRPVSLTIVGLVASPDQFVGLHNATPLEVSGGRRSISSAAANVAVDASEENLIASNLPRTIHPGIVIGLPHLKLEPQGGPACSSRITSTDPSVRLGVGSELFLTMQVLP